MGNLKNFVKTWMVPPGIYRMLVEFRRTGLKALFRSSEDRGLLRQATRLRNRHVGERCFIIGSGPTIRSQNLRKLKGESVISVSNTFVHPDYSYFRPRYHVTPSMLRDHSNLYSEGKFADWLREMEQATMGAEMFFHIGDRRMIESNQLFKGRTIHWIDHVMWLGDMSTALNLSRVPDVWSVSELAITIALYLGYERIYLLGFDHDWFNALHVHFYDHEKEHALRPQNIPWADAEFQMRRHADVFQKYKYLYGIKRNIFNANANPDHYLDVFPKVEYDSLFAES
jgi:hypothetical protein